MINYKTKPDTDEEIYDLLNPVTRDWFKKKFKNFSPPQTFAVKEIHNRNNILVSAPTGSGKTLTAFLSILNELINLSEKGELEDKVYCIYISPLKALANDVEKNLLEPLKEMAELAEQNFGIRVALRTGDTTAYERTKMLTKAPHIMVTTPESLALMLVAPKFRALLKDVKWTIIDEIHALASNKRGTHLALSIERLQNLAGVFTRIGLSATVADKPIRVNTPAKFCNLSIESARCVPLLFDANA